MRGGRPPGLLHIRLGVARQLGIDSGLLYRWERTHLENMREELGVFMVRECAGVDRGEGYLKFRYSHLIYFWV